MKKFNTMKRFKDFRTFQKVVRKYWKRHSIKSKFKYNGKYITSYNIPLEPWCYYLVTTEEELNKPYVREWLKSEMSSEYIDSFISKVSKSLNKEDENTTVILGGISLTNNGAELFFIDKNEKMKDYVYFVPFYMERCFKDRNLCTKGN